MGKGFALLTILGAGFLGTFKWQIVSWTHLDPRASRSLTYLILPGLAAVLSTGSAWSIVGGSPAGSMWKSITTDSRRSEEGTC